ncbi:MAG: endolytic transglycosylase MltG [Clostridiales bacterium]|nr:endolytic transglycosylase MltG [Clostridiales bacterium]
MGKKRKKDMAQRAAIGGIKGLIRLLIYGCVILAIIYAGRTAYRFGYLVFDQHPMAATKEEGQDVTVVVKEEENVYDIGKTLRDKGLIERPVIFWMQEKLSDYRGKIQPGAYLLNTSQNVEEILEILAKENTEGQPSDEAAEEKESGEETGE